MEFVTLVNAVNYCLERSIIDIAGVLETPLKLVTKKSLKMNNYRIMSTTTKIWHNNFSGRGGGIFLVGIFPAAIFLGVIFRDGGGVIFLGAIFSGHFSGGL